MCSCILFLVKNYHLVFIVQTYSVFLLYLFVSIIIKDVNRIVTSYNKILNKIEKTERGMVFAIEVLVMVDGIHQHQHQNQVKVSSLFNRDGQ